MASILKSLVLCICFVFVSISLQGCGCDKEGLAKCLTGMTTTLDCNYYKKYVACFKDKSCCDEKYNGVSIADQITA